MPSDNPFFESMLKGKIKTIGNEGIKKVKDESKELRDELQQKTVGYIAGGLGLVAGLAWNEAIKAFIEYAFPLAKNTLLAKFIYAVVITALVVIITVYLVRFLRKKEEKE